MEVTNYSIYSDPELTELLRAGDRSAFAEIYHRYKFILHHHAFNKTRNHAEVQDALQEVFANLWTKRETLQIGTNLSGYLYSAVRNHILNLIVREEVQSRYIRSVRQYADQQPIVTDHRVRENLLHALIEKEIAALPPRMREVFELSRKQHLSHREIAAIMGTSEQTVKKQMSNALKVLRSKLGLLTYCYLLITLR